VQGKPGSSLLMIENGTEHAQFGRKDFDLNHLQPKERSKYGSTALARLALVAIAAVPAVA